VKWTTVRLGELCSLVNGRAFTPSDWSPDGVPIIRIQNLNGAPSTFNCWAGALDRQVQVQHGDVLLAWSGTPGTSFGAYRWHGPSGVLNQHIFRVDLDEMRITRDWAVRAINARLQRLIDQAHGGVGLQHVTKSMVEKLPILLPPTSEQRRIAAILDKADALRAKRRRTVQMLASFVEAAFLDLFGEVKYRAGRWPLVPLEQIVRDTKLGLVRAASETGPDLPIPYLRMNSITRTGELDVSAVMRTHATDAERRDYALEHGDFLFNTRNSRELVGKTALFNGKGLYVFNNNIMRIRFKPEATPEYVAAAFRRPLIQRELESRKSGTTNVFAIYWKDLKTIKLPVPPIRLQRDFSEKVAIVEKVKRSNERSLASLGTLFASLQHRAFRGEL
jgi:type I restriction enzyme S subunit